MRALIALDTAVALPVTAAVDDVGIPSRVAVWAPAPEAMPADTLGLEVELLAAEVNLLEELIARGILPVGARRAPTAPELRAGVRFAELDRIVNDSAALVSRKADRIRDHVLDGLAEQLGALTSEADPWAALEQLAGQRNNGRERYEMTITNWDAGTGYVRRVAGHEYDIREADGARLDAATRGV